MRNSHWLLLIVILAAVLRVGWALRQPAKLHYPDAKSYDMIARNFIDTGELVQGSSTRISRMPLYPLYLSACYRLLGERYHVVARVVQALLGSLLCVLVFSFGKALFDQRTGLLAALVIAVYPFFVLFSGLLLTETFFILALSLFLYLLLWLERNRSEPLLATAAVAGVVAGLAVLLKPSFLLFLPFVSLLWLTLAYRPARALAAIGVIALITAAIMIPWIVRNWTITERFVPTTLMVGKSLYEGVYEQADGGPCMDKMPREVYGVSEYEQNRLYLKMAFNVIKENPSRILALARVKFFRFWNLIPNSLDHQKLIYRLVSVSFLVPILCFAVFGFIRAPLPLGQRLLLVSPAIYFTLLHMLFVSSIRYRVPVMPPIILLASVGFLALLGTRPQQDSSDTAAPVPAAHGDSE